MRPTIVKLGSLFSVVGAFIALALFGIEVTGRCDGASALSLILVAVLFFACSGLFQEGGMNKSQALGIALIGINAAVVIATYIVFSAFSLGALIALMICVIVIGVIAASEETARWLKVETI